MPRRGISLTYHPADDGGVSFEIDVPGEVRLVIPLSREDVLQTAASLLLNAGVTRAEYEDGRLDTWP